MPAGVDAFPPIPRLHDATAEELCDAYVQLSPRGERTRDGRHYTPAALGEHLWIEVGLTGWRSEGKIVDPACGAGSLLLPPLRDHLRRYQGRADLLATLPARFEGTDIDEDAVWLGNALVGAELLPTWAALPASRRGHLPSLLSMGDGLMPAFDRPALVIMNPPFGRVRLTPMERRRWSRSLYGHSNRYALFLHAAIERVMPGGVVAAVLPVSFLGGNYYQNLRRMVVDEAPLDRLVFVDERSGVFAGDVLQETCLAVFRRAGDPGPIACSRITSNGHLEQLWTDTAPPPRAPYELPWLLARRKEDSRLVARAGQLRWRMSDYGWKASTGPLVWNRHKPQISASPGPHDVPIVWAADIDKGRVERDAAREHQRWFRPRPEDGFMLLREPAVLVQRTTAPEQPRRLVAATLTGKTLSEWGGAVVIENHVNVLRSSKNGPLTPELLALLLDMPVLDRLYRSLSGSVAVSAYELEAVPMPPPDVVNEWGGLGFDELRERSEHWYDV